MRYFSILILSMIALACSTENVEPCKEHKSDGILLFKFTAGINNVEIETTREYRDLDRIRFRITDFKFYLQFIAENEDGDTISCSDYVHLLDVKDSTFSNFSFPFPKGKYKYLKMITGLDSSLNATEPGDYEAEHPMSIYQNTYWSWAQGYKFMALEGLTAQDPEDTSVLQNALMYHLGTNDCYQERILMENFEIEKQELEIINLHLNFEEIFKGVHELDITQDDYTQTANESELPLALKVAENFINAFEIN